MSPSMLIVQEVQSAGAVDPITDVLPAAGDGAGNSVDQHRHDDNRARDLQLKQDAYAESFEVFIRCYSEHHPTAAATFQKFWVYGMSLATGWQELYVQRQQELHHAITQHEQLQKEHEVLKANLMGLKSTVQNMLGDVSALLHHASAPQPAVPPSSPVQQKQPNSQTRQQSAQQLQDPWDKAADVAVCSDQGAAPAASSGTGEQLLQEPQPSAAPSAVGSRRSSHIVSSLISSIEKMSKQFADCQAGRLTPEAESFCCSASNISSSSSRSSSIPGSRSSSFAGNRDVRPPRAGSPAGSAAVRGAVAPRKDAASSRPLAQPPVANPQQHRARAMNEYTNRPAPGVPAGLAGARPSQSHPPSTKRVAASPATAQRHTLAWFLQNAGSPLSVSSSMPSPAAVTSAAAEAARSAGSRTATPLDTTTVTTYHRQKLDGKNVQSAASKVTAAAEEHSANAADKSVAGQTSATAEPLPAEANLANGRNKMAQAASKPVLIAPAGHASSQQFSREPSVSEWVCARSTSTSTAQGQSGSNSRVSYRSLPSSSNHSRSSSRASLASQPLMTQAEGSTASFTAGPEAAVSAPAAPAMGTRSASRGPSRGSLTSSGTSLTAMARSRQQQRQQQDAAGIYQFEPQADAFGSGRATSNMVAAAAAKLGLQLQQQQHLVQQRLCTSGSTGAAAPHKQDRTAAGNATPAAVAAEGPLTAGLHRQSSLARAASAGIGSTRQPRPASTPAAGQPGHSAVANGRARVPSPGPAANTGAAVRQRIPRAASAGAAAAGAAAAGAANGTIRKPSSRPSSGDSQKQQQQQQAGATNGAAEKRPLQHITQTRQAVMHSPTTAMPQGNPLTSHKQVLQDSPAKSGHSSSSEQSDMVLLGSCASTTGWSNQTSPAYDSSAPKRPSPALAAGTAESGVGKILPSQDNSSTSRVIKESAFVLDKADAASNLKCSGTAARNLNLSTHPSQTSSAVKFDLSDRPRPDQRLDAAVAQQNSQPCEKKPGVKPNSETTSVATETAVMPAAQLVASLPGLLPEAVSASGARSAGPHITSHIFGATVTGSRRSGRSDAQDSDQRYNDVQNQQDVNQDAAAPNTKSAQISLGKASMLEGLITAEQAISSTVQSSVDTAAAVATGAGHSTTVVMCAATADMVDPADLPDALKLPCRDDSPKKQLQKTPQLLAPAVAAALTIARASSEGKRSLQQSSSYTSAAAAAGSRQAYPPLRSLSASRASWEPQRDCVVDQVDVNSPLINLGQPGSPLSPLSKRFRSSCDHLLDQLRHKELLRDGRHGDQQLQQLDQQIYLKEQQQNIGQDAQQQVDTVILNQAGVGDQQVTVPQPVRGTAGVTFVIEENSLSEPAAGADTAIVVELVSSQQQQHDQQSAEAPLTSSSTAPDQMSGSSPATSGATASDHSIVTVWQATVPEAVATSTHSGVMIDLTGSRKESALATAAVHPEGMLPAVAAAVLTSPEAESTNHSSTPASSTSAAVAGSKVELGGSQCGYSDRSVPRLASFPVAVSMESLVSAASCESLSTAHTRTAAACANERVSGGHSRLAVASGPYHMDATTGNPEKLPVDDVTGTVAHGTYAESPAAADQDHLDHAAAPAGYGHCSVHASAASGSTTAHDAALPAPMPTVVSADNTVDELPEPVDMLQPHSCPRSRGAAAVGEDVPEHFSLQELLPIVLDVMAAKTAVDKECDAHQLPRLAPARHLQRYVKVKVPGDDCQYRQALAMLLASLDQHKDRQPEVAVLCRILGGEVDEDYFQHHLAYRSHLQLLAAHALLQHTSSRSQQLLQQPASYDVCCSAPVNDAQLSWLLGAWGRQRSSVVARTLSSTDGQAEEHQLHSDWWTAVNSHCMEGLRLTAGVVDALLLWELEQQVFRLAAVAGAFKTADAASRGLLDLQQFQVFCHELNDAMPDSEVTTLFVNELDRQGVGLVSFNDLCRCLLPAM